MNNDKQEYAELISRIRELRPQEPDSGRLTAQIMSRVKGLPPRKRPMSITMMVSIATSVAATVMVGLFLTLSFTGAERAYAATEVVERVNRVTAQSADPLLQMATPFEQMNIIINRKRASDKRRDALYATINNRLKNR